MSTDSQKFPGLELDSMISSMHKSALKMLIVAGALSVVVMVSIFGLFGSGPLAAVGAAPLLILVVVVSAGSATMALRWSLSLRRAVRGFSEVRSPYLGSPPTLDVSEPGGASTGASSGGSLAEFPPAGRGGSAAGETQESA